MGASRGYVYGDSLGFVIFDANRIITQYFMNALEKYGLTPALWNVINQLDAEQGISQCELSRRVKRTTAAIARLVATLEEKGLIERVRDTHDKRAFVVRLTPEGEELRAQVRPAAKEVEKELYGGLSEEDVKTLKRLLGVVRSNISEQQED